MIVKFGPIMFLSIQVYPCIIIFYYGADVYLTNKNRDMPVSEGFFVGSWLPYRHEDRKRMQKMHNKLSSYDIIYPLFSRPRG